MDIYEIIFLIHIIGVLGISGIKIYNLLLKGEFYKLPAAICFFVGLLVCWFFGLVVLATQRTLFYSVLFQFSSLFLYLNIFFLITEIIFFLEERTTETQERFMSET